MSGRERRRVPWARHAAAINGRGQGGKKGARAGEPRRRRQGQRCRRRVGREASDLIDSGARVANGHWTRENPLRVLVLGY